MTPIISVIVPVYNTEKYLNRCIDSILSQTFSDFELLLIDDGSTDGSGAISDEYEKIDSRVRVFHKANGGVSSARNMGIQASRGEFLLMLDSDDWLSLDAIEVLLRNQKEKNADCVIFGFNQTSGNIWAPSEEKLYDSLDELKKAFLYWLNTELLSSSVNKLYKKELVRELYSEDISFGEDLLFSLNYLEKCSRISFIKDPLYQHEVYNDSSLTHIFNLKRFEEIERIQKKILDFALDKSDKKLYEKYLFDCIRIIRAFLLSDRTYNKKKLLDLWVKNSFFNNLDLDNYKLIWQNRLLMKSIQKRCFGFANILVNWKRILRLK